MNNSLSRLVEGMVETLRQEIIPKLDDEFARGQAFGVIYMLNSIKLRAAWSPEFFAPQLEKQAELFATLGGLLNGLPGAPALPTAEAVKTGPTPAALETARNDADQTLSDLIGWLSEHRGSLPADRAKSIDETITAYLSWQTLYELRSSAKPMFAEISRGREDA